MPATAVCPALQGWVPLRGWVPLGGQVPLGGWVTLRGCARVQPQWDPGVPSGWTELARERERWGDQA